MTPNAPFTLSAKKIHYQLPVEALYNSSVEKNQGIISNNGVLCIKTGKFTGRSPEDKFIVLDNLTEKVVDWGGFNHSIEEKYFTLLKDKIIAYLNGKKELWARDAYASANKNYQIALRMYTELPWSDLFFHNMFIRPSEIMLQNFIPEWQIYHAPHFFADPKTDGTRGANFSIISFKEKIILIGGSAYTGEIKKGIFTVLNFVLPHFYKVLSMHCSANMGINGDVALFFGLSGTGKTSLSADIERKLIGDDEHGWDENSIFNLEGGCYAKTINLSAEAEPAIFGAIKKGALLENICFFEKTNRIDFNNSAITENTRVSYPIEHIQNIVQPAIAGPPKNIFFLTCDAYGVLPPISKLNTAQAMYQFISGYTAKIAGTEIGVKAPKATFSACFGAPFMPLHPGIYASLLGKKMEAANCSVWLVNTGWSGGPYGVGERIAINKTRKIIAAVLNGSIEKEGYEPFPIFNFKVPRHIEGIEASILQPENTWVNKAAYATERACLSNLFNRNFKKFEKAISIDILNAAPK